MCEFDEIISNLKEVLKLKNNTELAKVMKVTTQVMGNWKSRNKIPYKEIHTICVEYKLDLNLILNSGFKKNPNESINYKEENHKMIDILDSKKLEVYYYKLKAEVLENNLIIKI